MAKPSSDFVRLHSQMHEILKRVDNGTLDPTQVRKGLQVIIELPREMQDPRLAAGLPPWYQSMDIQIQNVIGWNALYGWGIKEENIPPKPDWLPNPERPLEVPVLAVYLPDKDGEPGYVRTFTELWRAITDQLPKNGYCTDFEDVNQENLNLTDETAWRHEKPGLHWVAVDFGNNLGPNLSIMNHSNSHSAHAEVLAGIAHFISGYSDEPETYIALPGYRYRDDLEFNQVPVFDITGGDINFMIEPEMAEQVNDELYIDIAIPTARNL